MRHNSLLSMFAVALLGAGAAAQTAQAGIATLRAGAAPIEGAITSVLFVGDPEGALQFEVSGLLTPNSMATLFVVVAGEGSRGMFAGPQVRSNSLGEFHGVIELPEGVQLMAIYLVAPNGDGIAAWMPASSSGGAGIVAGDWGFARKQTRRHKNR